MNEIPAVGAVIYTDGSAKPNPGFYGSGLHGYTYAYPTEKNKATRVNALRATDKGYLFDKEVDEVGAKPVYVINYLDSFCSNPGHGTNNVAEIEALNMFFVNYPEVADAIDTLHVMADSQYVINGVEKWLAGWIRNNWISSTGAQVSNQAQWKALNQNLQLFREHGTINFTWVKGHNDNFGNVKADYLAGIGTIHGTNGIVTKEAELTPSPGYHKNNCELHGLLSLKRIYFNTDQEFNKPGLYFQTGADDKDFDGKRTPEAVFSVVELNEPDPLLEVLISARTSVESKYNMVVFAKADRLKSSMVYPYLMKYGRNAISFDHRSGGTNFVDGKPIIFQPRPNELPMRAIDTLNHLEELLKTFKEEYLTGGNTGSATVHDITSHFYITCSKMVGKKAVEYKELKKEYKVGVRNTKVDITAQYSGSDVALKLPLVFQDDIPSRNTLKRLEALDPKIFLITWMESERLLRYGTIIQTSDGVGIWSNYFSNQHLFS